MKIGPHNIYEYQFSWKNHKIGIHISCFPPVFLAIRQYFFAIRQYFSPSASISRHPPVFLAIRQYFLAIRQYFSPSASISSPSASISRHPPVFLAITAIRQYFSLSASMHRSRLFLRQITAQTHLYSFATKNGLTLNGQPFPL